MYPLLSPFSVPPAATRGERDECGGVSNLRESVHTWNKEQRYEAVVISVINNWYFMVLLGHS